MNTKKKWEGLVACAVRALILVGIGGWKSIRKSVEDRLATYLLAYDGFRAALDANKKMLLFGPEGGEFRKALRNAIYFAKETGQGGRLPKNHDLPSADLLKVAEDVIDEFADDPTLGAAVEVIVSKMSELETREGAKATTAKQLSDAYVQLVDAEADLEIALAEAKRFVRKNSARDSEAHRALIPRSKAKKKPDGKGDGEAKQDGATAKEGEGEGAQQKPAAVPNIRAV